MPFAGGGSEGKGGSERGVLTDVDLLTDINAKHL